MLETLLISKPIAPPWNDSGKNLVRDLVRHCTSVRHRVLTVRGHSLGLPHVTEEPLYGEPGRFSPSLLQNARVFLRLLRPDRQRVYHFFFAPNPRTSQAGRLALTLKRRATVQTVMSVPRSFEGVERLLFADRVVTLSEHTSRLLREAGVEGVLHVPPGIDPPPPLGDAQRSAARAALDLPADGPVVVFPGDYEFSGAANTLADAVPRVLAHQAATFVYACRPKSPASAEIEALIRFRLDGPPSRGHVRFVGEVPDIRGLLAAADLVVLPAETTYAKMDIPLVLLEALAERTPVVVADVAPLNEVLGCADAQPDEPVGAAVPALDGAALADAICSWLADPDRRRRAGEAGRRWVESRFSASAMADAHADLYRSLAE